MIRSIWKGPFIDLQLVNLLEKYKKTKALYTRERNSTVLLSFIDRVFYIYNGKEYYKLLVGKQHVGFKLGSFSYTKKRCVYRNKKKTKKKK